MKRAWIYFQNPFLTVAAKSFKRAVKISTYHDSALHAAQGDPFFAAMYAYYHPFHLALLAAYNQWKTSGGTHKGATLTVEQLLALLSPTKINRWDALVQAVFAKGTGDYLAVFPNGHQPFQTGERDERVNAVEQLSKAMEVYPSLSSVKSEVDAFYTQLNDARTTQLGNLGDTAHYSDNADEKIRKAMIAMYADLGLSINKNPETPTTLEPLFDLETVRNHEQVIFTGTLTDHETEVIAEHTFADDDELRLENKGDTIIRFYLANIPEDGPGANPVIELAAHHKQVVKATDFGSLANHFLKVENTGTAENHYKVQFL